MQRLCCGVIADICRLRTAHQRLIETLIIGAVRQEPAFHHDGDEVRFRMVGHSMPRLLNMQAAV